jgi:hypothetical protein
MGSIFDTPVGEIDMSNGAAEEIESFCAERAAHIAERSDDPGEREVARRVRDFLSHMAANSGSGCYGFDVVDPPFDDLVARSMLARCVSDGPLDRPR